MLVGQHQPSYKSEIEVEVEKNDSGPKVKPFIKLQLAYNSAEKAKKMENLFKESFQNLLKLIAEE